MTPPDHRIAPRHIERAAVVYVRQSTLEQVQHHGESTRIQLGLRDRAIALGWPAPIVIDDDLGLSASGFADRPGFRRMLADVALRKLGIILCMDASRLSRNSRDWAQLFELCGHFDTLVADLEQVYDLHLPNDRLVMGIKGTVAEMELSVLRSRLRAGVESKAARGELRLILPTGFVRDADGRTVLDPDLRVQAAIRAMFDQFDRCTSVRQLALWYRASRTLFPARRLRRPRAVVWVVPTDSTLRKLLMNPAHAGVYAWGRRRLRVEYVEGRLVKRQGGLLALDKWQVCIQDHHEGYISWQRYRENQAKIAEARPRWTMDQNRGAVRDGPALLSGLLRCRGCGRMLHVSYRRTCALYYCHGGQVEGSKRCLCFGSKLADECVSMELCNALAPHALQASVTAVERHEACNAAEVERASMRVQAAQYEADRAFDQYNLADPRNRLVADSLEGRLNDRLAELEEARRALAQCRTEVQPLTTEQRAAIDALARDFPAVWNHPNTPVAAKKRILRAAIREIVVGRIEQSTVFEAVIHWQGGVHTRVEFRKRAAPVASTAVVSVAGLVRELAVWLDDAAIARILNMKRITGPHEQPWTQQAVTDFRRQHRIRHDKRQPDPDILTSEQAATHLGIRRSGLRGLVRAGIVSRSQVTEFAPWRMSKTQLDSAPVQRAVARLKATGRVRPGGCPGHQESLFPANPAKAQKEAL